MGTMFPFLMGIVIIALQNAFYFNLAVNLAKSIEGIPITLISDQFTHPIFDRVIKPKFSDHTERIRFNPFKLKTYLYDYTPYEETLYLDADNIALKDIHDLIEKLREHDFVMHEVKRWDVTNRDNCKCVWIDKVGVKLKEVLWAYGIPDEHVYPETNSSFIWFKKTPANEKYFSLVKELYMDRRVKYRPIGKCYPDEMAWGLASATLQHYSGLEHFRPIYHRWEASKKGGTINVKAIRQKYWFLGMAGGLHTNDLVRLYKKLTGFTFNNREKIFHVR